MSARAELDFPIGALVLVDGRHEARVVESFPEGSTSLLGPHFLLAFVGGGAERVKVSASRVGVRRAK